MTESNKETLIHFSKAAGFGLAAFIAIITYAGILNGVVALGLDSFYAWVGLINLGVEAFGFVKLYKYLFPKKTDKKEDSKK